MGIIDLRVLDLQAEHMPVAAQIGEAECIPLVVGYHAERALGGNAPTGIMWVTFGPRALGPYNP